MGVSEDIAPWLVREITGGSGRFADPFAEPNGYSIVEAEDEAALLAARGRYLDRLRYAVANADALVAGAFRREFYDFYGVDRARACSCLMTSFRAIRSSFSAASIFFFASSDNASTLSRRVSSSSK